MSNSKIQIRVNSIHSVNLYDLSPEFHTGPHKHPSWEFIYIDSGEICTSISGEKIILKQGDIIFHNPETLHETKCNGKRSASMFSIIFNSDSPSMEFFSGKCTRVHEKLMPALKKLINECNKTYKVSEQPLALRGNAPLGDEQLSIIYLEEFLILFLRAAESDPEVDGEIEKGEERGENSLVDDICQYLSENLYNKVTLKDVTEKFHFGKSYISEQFKKYTGDSVMSFYLELKLLEAKRLLREEDLTIGQISERLGFESPEYFSRYFKKRVGHSPRDFRKMLINSASLKRRES